MPLWYQQFLQTFKHIPHLSSPLVLDKKKKANPTLVIGISELRPLWALRIYLYNLRLTRSMHQLTLRSKAFDTNHH